MSSGASLEHEIRCAAELRDIDSIRGGHPVRYFALHKAPTHDRHQIPSQVSTQTSLLSGVTGEPSSYFC